MLLSGAVRDYWKAGYVEFWEAIATRIDAVQDMLRLYRRRSR